MEGLLWRRTNIGPVLDIVQPKLVRWIPFGRSSFYTQAQEFLKITIRFAVDEEGNLDKQELYFTDDLTEDEEEEFEYDNCGEGVSDPRHNGHWAEWLTDMGINKDPYEDE